MDLSNSAFNGSWLDNAHFTQANLAGAAVHGAILTNANLSQAYLAGADFRGATLTNANLSDAVVNDVILLDTTSHGFTKDQLYSTASYKTKDLTGINLDGNDLSGWNFTGQNLARASIQFPATLANADLSFANLSGANLLIATLTHADLRRANLTGASLKYASLANADLTDAVVTGTSFLRSPGFTKEQLYSTASYKSKDLGGITLGTDDTRLLIPDLSGWNFSGQNLAGANVEYAILTGGNLSEANLTGATFFGTDLANADLTDAVVRGANIGGTGITKAQMYSTASYKARELEGVGLAYNDLYHWDFQGQNVKGAIFTDTTSRGFTKEQLYSTSSHQAKDLGAIRLELNNLTGWNFAEQNLDGADFYDSGLDGANLSHAILAHASFYLARLTNADLNHANLTYAVLERATITNANLSFADTRGAQGLDPTGAISNNTILPDGTVNGLSLADGETLVAFAGVPIPVHVSGEFSIAPDATFDLTDNDLIVRTTADTKNPLHAEIQAKIVTAQNGVDANGINNWNGPGITSSSARIANIAAGFDLVGLGVIRNSDLDITTGLPGSAYTTFSGQPVTPDDVLVRYTYIGDGNLDGVVNFDDYVGMDNAFFGLIPNLGWATGDINYDGVINFDDYSVVDQAFFAQAAPLTSDRNGTAAVAESTSLLLSLAALGSFVLVIRRRATAVSSRADIFRWNKDQLIPRTEGTTPCPGVQLELRQLEFAQLADKDLTNSRFGFSDLTNAYM